MKPYGLKNYKLQTAYWEKAQLRNPADLVQAMGLLRPEMATVLQLHYLEGKTFRQIAGIIGKSLSTVRNHLNRGIFLIFQYLEYGEAPPSA